MLIKKTSVIQIATLTCLLSVLVLFGGCGDDGIRKDLPEPFRSIAGLFTKSSNSNSDQPPLQPGIPLRVEIRVNGSEVSSANVDPDDAKFIVNDVPVGPFSLVAIFLDNSRTVYRITAHNEDKKLRIDAEFSVEPVSGITQTPQVTITPTPLLPGGSAKINSPQDGEAITCPRPPAICRFNVFGIASPSLGAPGTPFNVFVLVEPRDPPGGGWFPQFPPASVDSETGEWSIIAQLGNAVSQPSPNDTLRIAVIVTDKDLRQESPAAALRFTRPIDVPGVIHISALADLSIGERI